jgi:hypothetical protein
MFSVAYRPSKTQFHSTSFQNFGSLSSLPGMKTRAGRVLGLSIPSIWASHRRSSVFIEAIHSANPFCFYRDSRRTFGEVSPQSAINALKAFSNSAFSA